MRWIRVEGHTFDYDQIVDVEDSEDLVPRSHLKPNSIVLALMCGCDLNLTTPWPEIQALGESTPEGPKQPYRPPQPLFDNLKQ